MFKAITKRPITFIFQVGENLILHVRSTSSLHDLQVSVFSSNAALVSSKRITVNSVSSKLITFDLALTEEMFPRITVLAWEVVGSGQIASATLKVAIQLERKDMQVSYVKIVFFELVQFFLFNFQFTSSAIPCDSSTPSSENCLLLSSPFLPPQSILTVVDQDIFDPQHNSKTSKENEIKLLTDGYSKDLFWKSYAWPLSCDDCQDCNGLKKNDRNIVSSGNDGPSWRSAENEETNKLIISGIERASTSQQAVHLLSVTPAGKIFEFNFIFRIGMTILII